MVEIRPNMYSNIVSGIKQQKTIANLEYIKQNLLEDIPKDIKTELTKLIAEREDALKASGDAFKCDFWYGKDLVNCTPNKGKPKVYTGGSEQNTRIVHALPTTKLAS